MTLRQRIARWFRATFGGGRSDAKQLSARLDDTYREQLQLLQKVRRGYADVDTSRKRVELQLNQLRRQQTDLEAQARDAVQRGDDAAARDLLGRKIALERAEADLDQRLGSLRDELSALQTSVTKIESDIEQFRVRKDTLNARHSAASARAEINSATTGINAATSEVGQAMSTAEQHTRELEATANAVDELVAEGVIGRAGEDPRQAELRRFDAEAAEIDRQLSEIQTDSTKRGES